MGYFRHPHLNRGVVHTPMGAFTLKRGVADLPDEIGESLGWAPVDRETDAGPNHSLQDASKKAHGERSTHG